MRSVHIMRIDGVVLSLVLLGEHANGQGQPATIPTVVAQAMSLEPSFLGRPQYFDGRLPTNWPAALIPAGARIVGGGVVGDSAMFWIRAGVFAFSGQANPKEVLRALVTGAGYARHNPELAGGGGGFVGSDPSMSDLVQYCKGSSLATFDAVDSVQAPLVFAIHLVDGEMARQNCAARPSRMMAGRPPITVPTLTPPSGAPAVGGGSSWGGSEGTIASNVRTTMPADSILTHYTRQLVAGGWKSEGKPAASDGVAVQRFSFREGNDAWTAALIILAAGDRRDVRIQFAKAE
jgi:hypothetical protein